MSKGILQRLVSYLWKHQNVPFQYGKNDCRTFASRWVDSELGTEYEKLGALLVRQRGLARAIHSARNPGGYAAMITEVTGVSPVVGLGWNCGDVAVFIQDNGLETLGVTSKRLVHAPGIHGLISFDASKIQCYWSLECLKR